MLRTVPLSILRSFHCTHSNGISYRFGDSLRAGSGRNCSSVLILLLSSCQQNSMTYTVAVCTVKTPEDGQRNCPKHVEFYSINKFEKLVHLVGFIIRIYAFCLHETVVSIISAISLAKCDEIYVT